MSQTLKKIMKMSAKIFWAFVIMIFVLILVVIVLFFVLWQVDKEHLTARDDGTVITLTLSPDPFSFQSDYHRHLRVKNARGDISQKLFMDTGWWRGSQLYRNVDDGRLMLHEGQMGCIELRRFDGVPTIEDILCPKSQYDGAGERGDCRAPTSVVSESFQFKNWLYLGRFYEVGYAPFTQDGECPSKDRL